ncbi:MAG: hypothetical protein ACLRPV_01715 [Lacrimispora saccharolytica]
MAYRMYRAALRLYTRKKFHAADRFRYKSGRLPVPVQNRELRTVKFSGCR